MENFGLSQLFFNDNYTLEYVLSKAKESHLNLNQLRDFLVQQQQDLNQRSLELFNNNYDQFYKLSHLISCLNEPIQHLQEPINRFENQLNDLCQNHDSYIDEINFKLSSIEDTCKNKELALKLISSIKRRDRLESQIKNIDWTVGPSIKNKQSLSNKESTNFNNIYSSLLHTNDLNINIEYRIKCDLIERLSIELYYLNCDVKAILATNDELISIKKSLQSNIDERQKQFDSWSERTFLAAIEAQDKVMTDLVLRIYKQNNSLNKIDLVWRNKIVKPYLSLTITDIQLNQNDQISKTFDLLHQFIERQLNLVNADFVIRSYWNEVINSLDNLEKIYSINNLESFQKRYTEVKLFLNKQHKYMQNDSEITTKSGLSKEEIETNCRKIIEKFNLQTYFNHRSSQLTTSVETSLSQQPLSEIPANSILDNNDPINNAILTQFKLKICMHIYVLITKCWSSEIYIESLELNFMQLANQIIKRFAEWLSKLRLSDFRITGPSAPDNNRQTNFLAKQDAIMRLLLEDCDKLIKMVKEFLSKNSINDEELIKTKRQMIDEMSNTLDNGLNNVKSLQRLIQR